MPPKFISASRRYKSNFAIELKYYFNTKREQIPFLIAFGKSSSDDLKKKKNEKYTNFVLKFNRSPFPPVIIKAVTAILKSQLELLMLKVLQIHLLLQKH
ncbi:MAG: hypothetical protein HY929_06305, partial [Euryarchaeota archaeon]|nr:hypothetical protein [Euryarchaeota archaeon]